MITVTANKSFSRKTLGLLLAFVAIVAFIPLSYQSSDEYNPTLANNTNSSTAYLLYDAEGNVKYALPSYETYAPFKQATHERLAELSEIMSSVTPLSAQDTAQYNKEIQAINRMLQKEDSKIHSSLYREINAIKMHLRQHVSTLELSNTYYELYVGVDKEAGIESLPDYVIPTYTYKNTATVLVPLDKIDELDDNEIVRTIRWIETDSNDSVEISLNEITITRFSHKLPPLQQTQNNIMSEFISCNNNLILILKSSNNYPACVRQSTAETLVLRNWGIIP